MKKKRGKSIKININLSNRWLYTLIAIGIIAILSVIVYAVVPNPGHSASDIEPCSEGQILKTTSGEWTCATDDTGAVPSEILYGTCKQKFYGYCSNNQTPAYCNPASGGSGSYCECPSGYIKVWTGSSGHYTEENTWNFFSCYK